MNRMRIFLIGILIAGIAGFFSPLQAETAKKSSKKPSTTEPPVTLIHISDEGMTDFLKQPKITPEHICLLKNPDDNSVHFLRFMEKGVVRVYQGNENLAGSTIQVAYDNSNQVYKSIQPGTDIPITVIAKYTWTYDSRGMLTISSSDASSGRGSYQFNNVTSSAKKFPGKIMYMGFYTPDPQGKLVTMEATKVSFGD